MEYIAADVAAERVVLERVDADLCAVQRIIECMQKHRDRILVVGALGADALARLRHTVYPTDYRCARSQIPSDLGFDVVRADELALPFDSARLCVVGLAPDDAAGVMDAVDAWNANPSCLTAPFPRIREDVTFFHGNDEYEPDCECFPPHRAIDTTVLVVSGACVERPGWVSIEL